VFLINNTILNKLAINESHPKLDKTVKYLIEKIPDIILLMNLDSKMNQNILEKYLEKDIINCK